LPSFYQKKRDFFLRLLATSRLGWQPSRGTYFVSAAYGHLPEYRDMKDAAFAVWLTQKIGVACIPTSAFYHDQTDDHVVRFCFAKSLDTLALAAERLLKL
jgi:methionine aminotransferase